MTLTPRLRKVALTAHVASSVGWLGAVVGVLALAIAGLASDDPQTVRGAYLSMELIGWFVLVPLSLTSLVSGIVQSLGSKWGLFRYYWVVIKLGITVVATVVLLMYTQTLASLADLAAEPSGVDGVDGLRSASPLLHAAVGGVLLLITTVLAVFKPPGMTRYGQRQQQRRRLT